LKDGSAGIIINTPCQFVETTGAEILDHAIEAFQVNVLVVMGHERLYNDLLKKYKDPEISILKLTKSGGVASRDKAFRKHSQMTVFFLNFKDFSV
jgi:polyribonucleotide 5'-hydroxyl-kinase